MLKRKEQSVKRKLFRQKQKPNKVDSKGKVIELMLLELFIIQQDLSLQLYQFYSVYTKK